MHVEHAQGLAGFLDGLQALRDVADGLDDGHLLASSRCRGWTAGDVLVHVHLGLQEMLLSVVTPVDEAPDIDAASYWSLAPPTGSDPVAGVHFVRLLGAAYRRPTGLVAHLRPTVDALAATVPTLPPGAVAFQGHTLATGDFLAARAVELAVHHLDLGAELPLPPPAPAALALARTTVEELAGGALPWDDETAVLIGTGRQRPDTGQTEDAGPLADRLPALG